MIPDENTLKPSKAKSSGIQITPNIADLDTDIYGAEIHHSQLSSGDFEAQLQRVMLKNAVFDSGLFNQRLSGIGTMPSNAYTFLFVPEPPEEGHLNKSPLTRGAWIYQPGDEIYGNIPSGFHWFTLSIQRTVLEESLETIGLDPSTLCKLGSGPIKPQTELNNLEYMVNSLYHDACVAGEIGHADNIEEKLLFTFLDAMGSIPSRQVGKQTQSPMLKRIEDFLRANLDRPITATELCGYLGCSRRQLEIVSKSAYDMGPVTYHRRMRLNEVRRRLLSEEGKHGIITSAAYDSGFSHLGRLSADYKSLFGESPRQTLQRVA